MIRYHILAAFAGCALDALFGDPRNIPHPVCGIGNLIAWLEARLRKWFPANEKSERRAGTALVVAVLLITGLASVLVLAAAYTVHPIGWSGGGKHDVRADDGVAFFEKGEHEGV